MTVLDNTYHNMDNPKFFYKIPLQHKLNYVVVRFTIFIKHILTISIIIRKKILIFQWMRTTRFAKNYLTHSIVEKLKYIYLMLELKTKK